MSLKCRLGLTTFLVAIGCPGYASAQSPGIFDDRVVARALAEEPDADLVRRVAELNETEILTPEKWPNADSQLVSAIITKLCGYVPPGYHEVLQNLNQRLEGSSDPPVPPLEARAGDQAYSLRWPACLYVTHDPRFTTHMVADGDTPTGLMEKLTGYGRQDEGRIEALFGTRNPQLTAGRPVTVRFATLPTYLRPRVDFATLESRLSQPGKVEIERAQVDDADIARGETPGSIIGPTSRSCNSSRPGYPIDTRRILVAFGLSIANRTPDHVRIVVVDNGFFGVPCELGNCPKKKPTGELDFVNPFPASLFNTNRFPDQLGPVLDEDITAQNYSPGSASPNVDLIRGHGTHVAGLVIGGAPFFPHGRDIYRAADDSWLKLIIVKLSEGTLTFPRGATGRMFLLLYDAGKVDVINLSLAISESNAQRVKDLVSDPRWQDAVFVAAAGNDSRSVIEEYPAALGGTGSDNVITVASVDATGALSSFTNSDPEHVDLAAPGCRISSWTSIESPAAEASGTSQAAALVSFGAGLLRPLMGSKPPRAIKHRLIYSGTLLPLAEDRLRTAYGVQLDLFKALLTKLDYIRYRVPGATSPVELVGNLGGMEGLVCEDGTRPRWENIRSFKRRPGASVMFRTSGERLVPCPATLAATVGPNRNFAYIRNAKRFSDARFDDFSIPDGVETSWIEEIVLADER